MAARSGAFSFMVVLCLAVALMAASALGMIYSGIATHGDAGVVSDTGERRAVQVYDRTRFALPDPGEIVSGETCVHELEYRGQRMSRGPVRMDGR